MKLTTNYSLKKPEGSDVVNIDDFNYNADIIDNAIQEIKNTSSTNKTSISSLQTKVNSGQLVKLTEDSGNAFNISGSNLNSYSTIVGRVLIGENIEHAPEHAIGSWWTIENYSNGIWGHQIGTSWFTGAKYMRRCDNGTWTHWERNIVDGQATKMTEDNGVCRGIPNNNANDIDITGFWMNSNVANAPITGWIYLESKVHNHLYQNQVATDLHDSSKRWTRLQTGGAWSEWRAL